MERYKKIFLLCMLVSLIMIPVKVLAAENPEVIYDMGNHSFQLNHVEGTNLFVDYDPVMPGDEITTNIEVQAQKVAGGTVTIYLASIDENIPDTLKDVILCVKVGDEIVSEKTLGKSLAEGERIKVAEFISSGTKMVEVTLKIPTSVGNELADYRQLVHWEWIAEERIDDNAEDNEDSTVNDSEDNTHIYSSVQSPQTGDGNEIFVWSIIFVGCMVAAAIVFIAKNVGEC